MSKPSRLPGLGLTLWLLVALAPLSVYAEAPHGSAPETATPHGDAEHGDAKGGHASGGDHWSFMNVVIPEQTQSSLKHAIPETYIEHRGVEQFAHVFFSAVAFVIVLLLALAARRRLNADPDAGVLPSRRLDPLGFFELVVGAVWGLMARMMGPDNARRFFPLIGTLAIYIFCMNAIALLPGGLPPTDNLNTNVVMGVTVFLVTHYAGMKAHGVGKYLLHFCGPITKLYALPLMAIMFVIELVSHAVRPASLSLRLMGNMYGDHQVLGIFLGFKIPLVPLPLMALGLMVVVVQTLVFVLLSTVYISLAVAHDDHAEGHQGEAAHGHH